MYMFTFHRVESSIVSDKTSPKKVIFFHGFGAPCFKYNFTQWDNDPTVDAAYKDVSRLRRNNWLDNLPSTLNSSEVIYYDREEENCLFPDNLKKSRVPNFIKHVQNLHDQLEKTILKPTSKLYLIGHSLGCMYALKYYLMFPERCLGLILIDSFQLIPEQLKYYLDPSFVLSQPVIDTLKIKPVFTDDDKEKWINNIFYDLCSKFELGKMSHVIKVKTLTFWNIHSEFKMNNKFSRKFERLLESKLVASPVKHLHQVELKNRDHYLHETDDARINDEIQKFFD